VVLYKEIHKEDGFVITAFFTAKRKPTPLEVVYNISKKSNSKGMPLKAFWLGKSHLLCRWSFTKRRKQLERRRKVWER